MSYSHHPSSYRDPSGFLFYMDGILYRQVNKTYKADFEQLMKSGLYDQLIKQGQIISHQRTNSNFTGSEEHYITIQPELLPYVSHPCEWSFDMLKDAALATLQLAEEGIKYKMLLKDASAYNIQLHEGRMKLIDSLSFERYDEHKPWIAYRQFCEHFFAPLALMHYSQKPLQQLLLAYPEGVPLHIAGKLLPGRSRFNLNVYLHIHLQSRVSQKAHSTQKPQQAFSAAKLKNILRSLREAIQSFRLNHPTGVWSDYYNEAAQRENYLSTKKQIIDGWISKMDIDKAIDLGANEGEFSKLLWSKDIYTISADFDHYSINNLYKKIKTEALAKVHPVIIDLANPTPAYGVNNVERASFINRSKTDLVLALALVHHLAIGKNIPFEGIVQLFKSLGKHLIIEFVPKEDEKIGLMLLNRTDIFNGYNEQNFIKAFTAHYKILDQKSIGDSGRTLFLMQLHEA